MEGRREFITWFQCDLAGHNSAYSMDDSTLTPTEPNLGELGSPQEQPYILRGVRDPPTLTRAAGQSGSKVRMHGNAMHH